LNDIRLLDILAQNEQPLLFLVHHGFRGFLECFHPTLMAFNLPKPAGKPPNFPRAGMLHSPLACPIPPLPFRQLLPIYFAVISCSATATAKPPQGSGEGEGVNGGSQPSAFSLRPTGL